MTPEERAEQIYKFWMTAHNTELIKKFIATQIYEAIADTLDSL